MIVFDPTPNPKLAELTTAFVAAHGKTYIGEAAWEHLEAAAGRAMAVFIEKYVRTPIAHMLEYQSDQLPDVTFRMTEDTFVVTVGEEVVNYVRWSRTQ